jgi:hypothetical protein
VLLVAMLPAVVRRSVLPLSTCAVTGCVLLVFTLNYASLGYWYACVVEGLNVACWAWLLAVSIGSRPGRRVSPGSLDDWLVRKGIRQ